MKHLRWLVVACVIALAGLFWMALQPVSAPGVEKISNAPAVGSGDAREFVVHDVRVFDGEQTIERTDVHVRDGLVVAVGEKLNVPASVARVDGNGGTLVPGLIDAHVHTWGNARQDALRFGVTTQLDMFTDPAQLSAARGERESLDSTDRADLWSAGYLATAAGGHGTQFGMAVPTLASAAQAQAWVAARKAEGSDWIKLVREDMHAYGNTRSLPTLDAATAKALVDAAHAQGLMALVHVSTLADASASIADGADGLVHIFHDAPADAAFVALARERRAFVVPTLTVVAGFSGRSTGLLEDAAVQPWLTPEQRGSLGTRFPAPAQPTHLQHALDSVRMLHAAGVVILAGTDAPNPNTAHGVSMHDELAWLVEAGLTPSDALAAATARAADAFSLDDRGRIAAGKRADLLLVEGDPTRDIRATRNIVAIWKNGTQLARTAQPSEPASAVVGTIKPQRLGNFEHAGASQSVGWQPSTDAMAGGASVVTLSHIEGGAIGSAGALRIEGEIKPGSPYPWAGVFHSPSNPPMQPMDASAVTALVFQVRGDGREYSVLLFAGEQPRPIPAQVRFRAGDAWTQVRVVLAEVDGFDPRTLRGISIAAQDPLGAFRVDVDAIELQ